LVEFNLPPVKNYNAFVELKVWKIKITNQHAIVKNGLEELLSCPKTDFSDTHFLIKIFCILPVSITPKKYFSTLTRLKTNFK
jgi:hypothetical protein